MRFVRSFYYACIQAIHSRKFISGPYTCSAVVLRFRFITLAFTVCCLAGLPAPT